MAILCLKQLQALAPPVIMEAVSGNIRGLLRTREKIELLHHYLDGIAIERMQWPWLLRATTHRVE